MPKIQLSGLPQALRDHLFERLRERKISTDDLYQLKLWRESEPDAPEGPCTRILALSRFAERARIPRRSCFEDTPQSASGWTRRQATRRWR